MAERTAAGHTSSPPDSETKHKSAATILIEMGLRHDLFHDADGEAYARVRIGNHREVFRIESSDYRDVLTRLFYLRTATGANRNAIGDAMATLKSAARFGGVLEPVSLRVAAIAEGIAIDLGTADWQTAVIGTDGWRLTPHHVTNFRCGTKPLPLPLPLPAAKANFDLLWRYVNVAPTDRVLVAAWLLAALQPRGPYPILLLLGEQGTGKSCTSRTLKALTDPSGVALRSPPRDERDLLVSALHSRVLVLDNLSGASTSLSDALCRLATGGSLAGRKLYSDAEEAAFDIQRPVILNGIDDVAGRPDLAERCLHLVLPPLATRDTEAALAASFASDGPCIMAALLDGLACALAHHASIAISDRPRMADFTLWAAAGLPALGFSADEFVVACRANQHDAIEKALEASPFCSAVRALIDREGAWKGTATQLLHRAEREAGEDSYGGSWPRTATGVGCALRRHAPALRSVGIEIQYERNDAQRLICLAKRTQSNRAPTRAADDARADTMTP